jgi:hypothetical protein
MATVRHFRRHARCGERVVDAVHEKKMALAGTTDRKSFMFSPRTVIRTWRAALARKNGALYLGNTRFEKQIIRSFRHCLSTS